jgi:hypothetical protein
VHKKPSVFRLAAQAGICAAVLAGGVLVLAPAASAHRATPATQQKYHTHYAPAANLVAQKETPHRPAWIPR